MAIHAFVPQPFATLQGLACPGHRPAQNCEEKASLADPGVLWKKAPRAIRGMRGKTLETVPFQPYFGCTKSFLRVLSSEYCQATRAMRATRVLTVPLQPFPLGSTDFCRNPRRIYWRCGNHPHPHIMRKLRPKVRPRRIWTARIQKYCKSVEKGKLRPWSEFPPRQNLDHGPS